MDADFKEKRRARVSQREKRWSMNSQRLEEIVGELMKPISDLRRSFDTDLSALLEEYLTEAGLHALDEADRSPGSDVGPPVTPNFAELALLLQQSATVYGRKVDFLYQHVLSVSDSLHNSTLEITNTADEPQTPGSRRRRRTSIHNDYCDIALEASSSARREPSAPRPPPTLPRMYVELEPRVLGPHDLPLLDYGGEPVGLLSDFHVAWRLQDGLLVDELEGGGCGGSSLRAIPLLELQAAIEAGAPSPLPPRADTPPPACSTPLPVPLPPAEGNSTEAHKEMPPPPPPLLKKERKRKNDTSIDVIAGTIKLHISQEMMEALRQPREFSIEATWVRSVVAERKATLLAMRQTIRGQDWADFRGFEYSILDISGFTGWSASEAATALSLAALVRRDESDDDGFFDQSSLESLSGAGNTPERSLSSESQSELAAWQANVLRRAAACDARGLDVRILAERLLATLPATTEPVRTKRYNEVLRETAADDADVSRLFLATLFLANAGNVEVECGPPLSLNSFSLSSRQTRGSTAPQLPQTWGL